MALTYRGTEIYFFILVLMNFKDLVIYSPAPVLFVVIVIVMVIIIIIIVVIIAIIVIETGDKKYSLPWRESFTLCMVPRSFPLVTTKYEFTSYVF